MILADVLRKHWRIWWCAIWVLAWLASPIIGYAQGLPGDPPMAWDAPAMLENWKIISAFLLPLAMSFIIQSNWPRGVQALATFFVAFVVTVVKYAVEGGLSNLGEYDVVPTAMTIFALAIPAYYGLWKPTGVAGGIERSTNVTEGGKRVAALEASRS